MSTTVDNKVVEMRFDNKQFEDGVKTSLSTIDKLKQSLNFGNVTRSFDEVASASKRLDFSGMQDAIDTVHGKFSAFEVMAVTALANITNSAINTGKRLVASLSVDQIAQGWQKFSDKTVSVGTLISQGYELEEVNEQLSRLNWFTDETSYNFTDMVSNIAKFTASGKNLKDSVTAMEGIANWAALSGQNAATASRAMYQISQAMGAGIMRLEDYKSIQNASMDTDEFRQKCLDAAIALGTLKKNADGTYQSLVNEDADSFSKSSFASALTEGKWFTSDVMMKVFGEYSAAVDQIYEYADENGLTASQAIEELGDNVDQFGLKAFKAAQEARTFADVIDSVKDAVSTGWMNTFENIFGNYEEAKSFWTDLANAMYDVFAGGAETRNELLAEWKELGGRNDLLESFWNIWESIEKIVTPIKEAFRDIFPAITSERLKDITGNLKEFTERLKISDDTAEKIKDTLKGVFSVFNMLKKTISAVAKSFSPLFDNLKDLGSKLLDTSSSFGKLLFNASETANELGIFEEITKRLSGAIKALSDFVFNFANNAVVSFGEGGEGISGILEVIFDTVADVTRMFFNLASSLTGINLDDTRDKVVKVIQKIRNHVVDAVDSLKEFAFKIKEFLHIPDLQTIKDKIKDLIETIKENFQVPGFELLHNILERIHERVSQTMDFLSNVKTKIIEIFNEMVSFITGGNILAVLENTWKIVKGIISGILKGIGMLMKAVSNGLGDVDFSKTFDIFNSVSLGAIAAGLVTFVKGFRDAAKDISSIKESFVGILDGVKDCLSAFTMEIKADALMKIAGALAILAASILVISLINSDKLTSSLEALTVMFIDIIGALTAVDKLVTSRKGISKAATAMVIMSASVLVLASALKKISEIESDKLTQSIVAVTALIAELVVVSKTLSTDSKGMIKSAASMVIFSAAIRILVSACKDFSTMSWEEIGKGLLGVGTLFTEIDIFLNTAKFNSKAISNGAGIVLIAAAMKVLASACKDFSAMSWEEIGKGLASIGAIFVEIAAFTNLSGNAKHVLSTGVSLIAIAAAMKIFTSAIKDFGSFSWEEIAKGLVAMGGALAEIILAVNLMPKNMVGIGLGLVLVGASLEILVNVLRKFGGFSWEEIGKGLLTLGIALGELVIALNAMTGTLAGAAALAVAAASLLLITPVLSILGAMSWEAIAKGLVALAGAFTIIGVAGAVLAPILPAILGLGAALALIGVGVLSFGVGLVAIGVGITALGASLTTLSVTLTAIASAIVATIGVIVLGILDMAPQIIGSLADIVVALCDAITAIVPSLGETVKAVILTLVDVIVECAPDIAEGLLVLLDEALKSLSEHIGSIADSLFEIVIAIFDSISEHAPEFIKSVVGVFTSIFDGVADLFDGGGDVDLLESIARIGQALGSIFGSFIGGIAGGILDGVIEQFPKMGENLADFMTNAKPFFDGIKSIDSSSVEAVNSLTSMILALTASELIDRLTSWFTGKNSMAKFGRELSEFGPYLVKYSESIKGIDSNTVKKSAEAGKALAEMAKAFPNDGGVVGFFMGENSASKFGENIAAFGKNLKQYSTNISGIKSAAIINSIDPALKLAEMAKSFPNDGGVVGFFMGENNASKFGENIAAFGAYLAEYGENISEIEFSTLNLASNSISKIVNFAVKIPVDSNLKDFGKGLAKFGDDLAEYVKNISSVDAKKLDSVNEEVKTLVAIAENISQINSLKISDFGKSLTTLAKSGIDSFVKTFTNSASRFKKSAEGMISDFLSGVKNSNNVVKDHISNMMDICMKNIESYYTEIKNLGEKLIVELVLGFDNKRSYATSEVSQIIRSIITSIRNAYSDFNDAGQDLMQGFVNGITVSLDNVSIASKKIGKASLNGIREELLINSPSKKAYEVGNFFGQGFIEGLSHTQKGSYEAAYTVGESARNGLSEAIDYVYNLVDGSMDIQPVITPVVDLTNVTSSARQIGDLFDSSSSITLARETNPMSMTENGRIQNEVDVDNSDIVNAINSLKDDVSSLYKVIGSMKMVLDSGELVGAISPKIDTAIGNRQKLVSLGVYR